MSIKVISLVLEKYPEGGARLLTMIALADWASDDGARIFPSIETLAIKTRMSERQTRRILRHLEDNKFITNLTPENRGGKGKSNHYRIEIQTLSNCPAIKVAPDPNPDIQVPNPDIQVPNPDTIVSDYPLEPLNPLGYPDISNTTDFHPDVKRQIEFMRSLKKSTLANKHDIATGQKRLDQLMKDHHPQKKLPI